MRATLPTRSRRASSRSSITCSRPSCWRWRGSACRRSRCGWWRRERDSRWHSNRTWRSRQMRRSDTRAVGRTSGRAVGALVLVLVTAGPADRLSAQDVSSLTERLSALTAVSGSERALTDSLLAWLPGSARDRFGNVTLALGKGEPKRLASCAVDEVGYIDGNITDDGYVRLRRVPGVLPQPLFDQQMLEGQRVTAMGDAGPVPGVVAVRSTHLTRFRGGATPPQPPFPLDAARPAPGAPPPAHPAPPATHL